MTSAAEKHAKANTLSCVIGLCIGKVTTVELRNESHVTGRVVEVDGFMNTTLREAEFCDPMGFRRKFDVFFVPKRLIRYVQIPPEIDIKSSMEKMFGDRQAMGRGRGRGKGANGIPLGGARKKIMSIREQRRKEDVQNALKMKQEMEKVKELKQMTKK